MRTSVTFLSNVDDRLDTAKAHRRRAVEDAGYNAAASALLVKIEEALDVARTTRYWTASYPTGVWLKLTNLQNRLQRTLEPGARGRESRVFAHADLVDSAYQMSRHGTNYPTAAREAVEEALRLVGDWPDSWEPKAKSSKCRDCGGPCRFPTVPLDGGYHYFGG